MNRFSVYGKTNRQTPLTASFHCKLFSQGKIFFIPHIESFILCNNYIILRGKSIISKNITCESGNRAFISRNKTSISRYLYSIFWNEIFISKYRFFIPRNIISILKYASSVSEYEGLISGNSCYIFRNIIFISKYISSISKYESSISGNAFYISGNVYFIPIDKQYSSMQKTFSICWNKHLIVQYKLLFNN